MRDSMHPFTPEGMGYLPAYFRGDAARQNRPFVAWFIEAFEANLHLVERIIENSPMLFDPERVALFCNRVCPPTLLLGDLVDMPSLAAKLSEQRNNPDHPDKVSQFVWRQFSDMECDAVSALASTGGESLPLQSILVRALNRIILGPSLDQEDRFAEVKFSCQTRAWRARNLSRNGSAKLNRLLLQDAYPSEIRALPETPALDDAQWKPRWLQWLASFLYLDLDPEWLAEASEIEGAEKEAPGIPAAGQRYDKVCELIKQAVALYRRRGTPKGLEAVVKAFYDWDIRVVERSWPEGMNIGVASRIGLDTRFLDEPDLDRQFVVLLESASPFLSRLPELGERVESDLMGQSRGLRIKWFSGRDSSSSDALAELSLNVNRLRRLIDREIPAHTRYYLAFGTSEAQPPAQRLPPLRIEVNSTIERFWIN